MKTQLIKIILPLLFIYSTASLASEISADDRIKAAPCSTEITACLKSWESQNKWTEQLNVSDGSQSFISPTAKIGSWVELRFLLGGQVVANRISPDAIDKNSWDKACAVKSENKLRSSVKNQVDVFTDHDLMAVLKESRSGAFYLWSPHMPCSVKGLGEAEKAAKTLGVKLVALLDPTSNRKFAVATAKREGFRSAALKEVSSIELIFRGLTVHAPSFLLFSDGEIRGEVLRGFRQASEYERFLGANFKK